MIAVLALEDGTCLTGVSAGAPGETSGEVVFNTSLTGYQEVLTDPSYAGQIVTMTAPQIGNYGVASADEESSHPQVAGFVIRDASPLASNWRAQRTLRDYLVTHGIVAISDVDTRALTRHLRSGGVLRGIIATGAAAHDTEALVQRARAIAPMEGSDLVSTVTCTAPYDVELSADEQAADEAFALQPPHRPSRPLWVAAYDFGIKRTILRRLVAHGCQVRVFPASTPAAEVLAWKPDGIFLSNGPGDPSAVGYAIETIRTLVTADVPMFGICLGHQLLGLALGARTYKLKFGHRGGNHPVKNLDTGAIEITAQNHGFAVDPDSLPATARVTHLNLYDGTVEGLCHRERPITSVQYHPEAAPGPHDADYLFQQFIQQMESH
jgi:carbamoyl-phosphate synthase small subunit